MMPYSIRKKGRYRVIDIDTDVENNNGLSDLTVIIKGMLDQGRRTIAVRFTPRSYFGTRAVHDFVNCLEMITEKRGRLAVISPNKFIHHFVGAIDFDRVVTVCDSEDDLVVMETVG